MNENILKAKGVELLCQYTNNDKLVKFIATLPKYKINTLYDVKMVKRTIINSIPGFGETKWRRLEEVRDVLNNNIQEIISTSELAGADIVEIGSETPNTVNHTAILNHIPETVMSIPIYWLLESGEVSSDYESIIRNTLKGYTIKDILTLDVCKLSQLRGVGIHKQEMVIKFKESVLSIVDNKEKDLEAQYIASKSIPVLPSPGNAGESYTSLIKRFIDEVSELYKKCGKKDCADAIRLAYQYGYDINSIAVNKKKTRARIEQWLTERNSKYKSFVWVLKNNILASNVSDMLFYAVSDEFCSAMQNIEQLCKKTPLEASLKTFLGDGADDNVINFILHYLGAKIFDGKVYGTLITERFVIINCELQHLTKKWGAVFNLMRECVKPINKDTLIIHLRKKFKQLPRQVEDVILNIIENSNQFDVKKTDLTTEYSLTWQELLSMQSRIERILYEKKEAMQRKTIEEEYNRRLRIYGLSDPEVFNINASKNIHQLHQGGTWIWKEYTNINKTISRTELIRQYVAKVQKFRMEEIMEYLREIIPDIKERSVKTILTSYCRSTTEGYYIDRNCKADFSDLHIATTEDILPNLVNIMNKTKEYTYRDLGLIYSDKYKISVPVSKIRTTCNNSNFFIIIKGLSRKVPNKVKINPEWDGCYKPEVKDGKRGIQAEWKKRVREEMICKLRYSPNYEMASNELCKHIASFVPSDISNTGVYKIFQDESIFIVKEKTSGRGNIIALNIEEWEKEYKQHLVDKDDCATTYKYEAYNERLKQVQQQQSSRPLYNMSTKNEDDLNNLYTSMQSLISYNLQQLVRDNMGIVDFKDVWSYMIEQMNIREGGVDNAYYRMLNQLYGYMFGSTTRNDRYFLWVEIRLNYEPYLKKLLSLRGFPVVKIKGENKGKEMQLKDLINQCQENNILPKKEVDCFVSKCISHILTTRNFKGHNAENTPNDTIIVQNIQKVLILYLYTTMKLKK